MRQNLTAVISPYRRKTLYGHDADGNITSKINELGIREYLLEYDVFGNVVSYTDGNGGTTLYTRDKAGRVTTVEKPDGSREYYKGHGWKRQ